MFATLHELLRETESCENPRRVMLLLSKLCNDVAAMKERAEKAEAISSLRFRNAMQRDLTCTQAEAATVAAAVMDHIELHGCVKAQLADAIQAALIRHRISAQRSADAVAARIRANGAAAQAQTAAAAPPPAPAAAPASAPSASKPQRPARTYQLAL